MTKYMDLREFVDKGFLQEANRLFFHPHGLALEIKVDDDGVHTLNGILDYRDDPEGCAFVDLSSDVSRVKARNVEEEYRKHWEARDKLFGGYKMIQPIGHKFND
jgi:hypothetical protein